jgi:hypothetical protein
LRSLFYSLGVCIGIEHRYVFRDASGEQTIFLHYRSYQLSVRLGPERPYVHAIDKDPSFARNQQA